MSGSGIPTEVERFLTTHIRSVEQLEVLLLVSSTPEQEWSVGSVYQVIKSSEGSVRERLQELNSQGLLEETSNSPLRYRFASNDAAVVEVVGQLASVYKERRVKVVQILYAPPTSSVQEFANAFKLRKDK